jgi:hypothetical protein
MCQSKPRGIPGLAHGAGVDVGREICPGGANPGPERVNPAWEEIIRPGPGNPGLAWPEQCADAGPRKAILARSDPPDLAQPGVVEMLAHREKGSPAGGGSAGPAGMRPGRPGGGKRVGKTAGTPA